MGNNRRSVDWNRIERIGLYFSLIIFIVFHTLSFVVPSIIGLLPKESPFIILATIFLIAIHHLIKIIETSKHSNGFIAHLTFSAAFNRLVEGESTISNLVVSAYTSAAWFEHIHLSPVKIDNLKVLLCYDPTFTSKYVEGELSDSRFNIEDMIASWKHLVTDKQIKKLEIRRISMAAPIYFGVINREKGMFGFLWPRAGISGGLEPREAAFVYSQSDLSQALLAHAKEWFESVWEVADKLT